MRKQKNENSDGSYLKRRTRQYGQKDRLLAGGVRRTILCLRRCGSERYAGFTPRRQPPLDPSSDAPNAQTDATMRFKQDAAAQNGLAHTVKLACVAADEFDAVFYPGGHGPLWDLANDKHSIALIEAMDRAGKPVALVCHAPGVLKNVLATDGTPLVKGKHVSGFSDSEEEAAQLTKVVPFLVEDELKRLGGLYAKGPDWTSFVQVDGNLITGQNPASSAPAASDLLKLLTALHGTK